VPIRKYLSILFPLSELGYHWSSLVSSLGFVGRERNSLGESMMVG